MPDTFDTFDTVNSSNTRTLTDVTDIDAPSYQEGYLNQLEKNWSNPDPGPDASVTSVNVLVLLEFIVSKVSGIL